MGIPAKVPAPTPLQMLLYAVSSLIRLKHQQKVFLNYFLMLPPKSFGYPKSSLLNVRGASHIVNYHAMKEDHHQESNYSRFFCQV